MSTRILAVPIALVLAATSVFVLSRSQHESSSGSATAGSAASDVSGPQDLPAPKGPVVLTVHGVTEGNAGRHTTKLDFKTLDGLAREQFEVYEPFLKQDIKFTGITMSDLFAALGVSPSAKSVYGHALDDYHVDLPVAGLKEVGVLATRVDGKRMQVADGGPIRLMLMGDGDIAKNTDNWIWSIDWMRVHG